MWPLFLAQEQTAQTRDISTFIDELARTPLSKVIMFVGVCTLLRLAIAPFIAKAPTHKRGPLYNFARFVNEALDAVIYAGVFVFLIIRPFCIQAFKIPSGSMLDTLQINDFIVANKAIYRYTDPKVNDIVVFRPPKIACLPNQLDKDGEVNVDFIKRCVGDPGDVVEIKNGVLYRNGKPQPEPFIREKPRKDFKFVNDKGRLIPLQILGESVNDDRDTADTFRESDFKRMDYLRGLPAAPVPKGWFLMMGDNRNESFDGRAWGFVPKSDIIGRSEFIWLPFNRWRVTR